MPSVPITQPCPFSEVFAWEGAAGTRGSVYLRGTVMHPGGASATSLPLVLEGKVDCLGNRSGAVVLLLLLLAFKDMCSATLLPSVLRGEAVHPANRSADYCWLLLKYREAPANPRASQVASPASDLYRPAGNQ